MIATRNVFTGALAVLTIALVTATPASAGLVINLDYSSGTAAAQFGGNFGLMQAAMTYAAQQYDSLFSDPIHINIKVEGVAGTGTLGASNSSISSIGYGALRTALLNDVTSPDDSTATGPGGSIGAVDPISGTHTYWLTRAQDKALKIIPDDGVTDGTVTFGAGWTYTFDPSNRAVPGAIDFIGVAEHELSEVMARIGLSGGSVCLNPPTCSSNAINSYSLTDLFSFSGPGTLNPGNNGGSFSINNGNTLIKAFNNASIDPGTDTRDWAAGTNDSYNARSSNSVKNDISAADVRLMDVLGYDLAVPEPSSVVLILSGLVAGGLRKKLARRAA